MSIPSWPERAACGNHPRPELWEGRIDGETNAARDRRHVEAAKVCATCPVRDECWAARPRPNDGLVRAGRWDGHRIPIDGSPMPKRQYKRREKPKPRPVAMCGTYSGYRAHYRRGEKPCEECLIVGRAWVAAYKRRKRAERTAKAS